MRETSIEKMRYSVPKVKNRFFAVHKRFILLCAILCALSVILALSYITIRAVYRLEPKASFLFFCEVDDLDDVKDKLSKFDDTFNIIFVRYDDRFKGEGSQYNFSELGEDFEKYNDPNPNLLVVVKTLNGATPSYTYDKLGLEISALTAEDIERVISETR